MELIAEEKQSEPKVYGPGVAEGFDGDDGCCSSVLIAAEGVQTPLLLALRVTLLLLLHEHKRS
eukprot:scaffold540102_cov37-Prasinocladus_malaysianus.AAC.1